MLGQGKTFQFCVPVSVSNDFTPCTLMTGDNFNLTCVRVRSPLREVKSFYPTHWVNAKFQSLTFAKYTHIYVSVA